eukprot:scaffold87576_cov27-Phaeocystis_antarctica.AAC.1
MGDCSAAVRRPAGAAFRHYPGADTPPRPAFSVRLRFSRATEAKLRAPPLAAERECFLRTHPFFTNVTGSPHTSSYLMPCPD